MDVDGARCLVIAGGRGLGREIALDLAAAGAGVAVSYHDSKAPAAATREELARFGGPAIAIQGDVRTATAATALVEAADVALTGLDAVVFAASGPFVPLAPQDIEPAMMRASLEIVAAGFFFVATAARRLFERRGEHGVIIAITDVIGAERPSAMFAAHAAAKAAQAALVRSLAKSWIGDGVRVCGVAPGPVSTTDDLHPENTARAASRTLLGRPGDPRDIAAAVRFCIENESLTGVDLVVDGGLSLR
jgi:NAD(P)-dependent dehydrogenase (short-subunit alcohol dehydrogenase family)